MKRKVAIAFSGGPDSVFLLNRVLAHSTSGVGRPLLIHVNHGLRGAASDGDQRFAEQLAESLGLPIVVGKADPEPGSPSTGIEARARSGRYAFIRKVCVERGVRRVLVAHTADDQVETILMRFLEGAGITGLKGIPPSGEGGIERPLMDVWRSEVIASLDAGGHGYRVDESNADTRFERNWVRHELLPMLTGRYGEAVKRRILETGKRLRELDAFIGSTADRWIRRNVKGEPATLGRPAFARLPGPVRIAILQRLVVRHAGKSPNERLLLKLDELLISGKPSARIRIGSRTVLRNSYGTATIAHEGAETGPPIGEASPILKIEDISGQVHRFAGNGGCEIELSRLPSGEDGRRLLSAVVSGDGTRALFDLERVPFPLTVEPLAAGDAIVPFGGSGSRKAKEIMIDLKIPREARWGRATVRDAAGRILWIPGVARSDAAPVSAETRHLLCLTARPL